MPATTIKTGFTKLGGIDLVTKTQFIISSLKNNDDFPDPRRILITVEKSLQEFNDALIAAGNGDRIMIEFKKAKRQQLEKILKTLAAYVILSADGDRTKLTGSGFDLAREAGAKAEISRPEKFKISNGLNSGELVVSIAAVAGAKSYIFQYTNDPLTPDNTWITEVSTRRKHVFTNLQPGKKCWFRIAAVGSPRQVVYSEVYARYVQ